MDNSEYSTRLSTECGRRWNNVLLIFAKQPAAGQVKTRLVPPLTPHQAAVFYAFSQRQTIQAMQAGNHDVVVCYSGERSYFERCYPHCELMDQGRGDLGDRLKHLFAACFNRGWQHVCVIGTDSPDLPQAFVDEAFAMLSETDFVLVAAQDGGYVLAGSSRYVPQAFDNITWSSELVLEQTVERLVQCQLIYRILGRWEDIDERDSLHRYIRRHPDSLCAKYAQRCLRANAVHLPKQLTGE